jgi:hypothetical protein
MQELYTNVENEYVLFFTLFRLLENLLVFGKNSIESP